MHFLFNPLDGTSFVEIVPVLSYMMDDMNYSWYPSEAMNENTSSFQFPFNHLTEMKEKLGNIFGFGIEQRVDYVLDFTLKRKMIHP